MPVATSEYARVPLQVGDKGFAIAADAYLGGNSGLGGGTADLTRRGNLTPLVFCPIGNTAWFSVDLNAFVIYGQNGVVLEDKGKHCIFTLTPSAVTIAVPSGAAVTVVGDLHVTGEIVAKSSGANIHLSTHTHGGIQAGSAHTQPPDAGT